MHYRAEIDGLRALAVLPVILFHAGFGAFSGGFIGVDIFFVISGYLITGLIYEQIDRGSFSLVEFYERRARRILPALFLVMLVCIPFAWQLLLPRELKDFGTSLIAVSAFVSNFYFRLNSDYFAPEAATTPLHHTWSLAVEEQFYLVYPLLLLLLRRAGRKAVFGGLLLGTIVSLGLAEHGNRTDPSGNFYLLPGRAWELGIGALVALADQRFRGWKVAPREFLSAVGIVAIGISLAALNPAVGHPGLVTLLPVLGTAALIAFATKDTVVGRMLASRALVTIGLISYSAYLWHQPLFAFARILWSAVNPAAYLLLTGVTFVLAYGSWRFVEQPLRQRHVFRRSQIFTYAAVASISVVGFGVIDRLTGGFPNRFGGEAQLAESWFGDWSPTYGRCTSRPGRDDEADRACVHGALSSPKIAIVGDSHAATISHRLAQELAGAGYSLIEFSRTACPPAAGLSIHTAKGRGCAEYYDRVRKRVLQGDIQTVVMFARWSQYVDSRPFDNLEGGRSTWVAQATPIDAGIRPMSDQIRMGQVSHLYVQSVEELLRHGIHVVLVYPVPEVGWNVPKEMLRRMRVSIGVRDTVTTNYEAFRQRHSYTHAAFDGLSESPNLIRVRPEEIFCNTVMPGRCVAEMQDKPLYFDDSHLNESSGAKIVVEQIVQAMTTHGWIEGAQLRGVRARTAQALKESGRVQRIRFP